MARESKKARTLRYLREARDMLSKRGAWVKQEYGTKYGECYCAMGALQAVASDSGLAADYQVVDRDPAAKDAVDLLTAQVPEHIRQEFGGEYGSAVIEFNDRPSRRKKDVLNLFDRAIEAAEKR